jgi:hypothetical protein
MSSDTSSKARPRRVNSGSLLVKVSTRRTDRMRQLEQTSEFRVDEHGALMIATASTCNIYQGDSSPEADVTVTNAANGSTEISSVRAAVVRPSREPPAGGRHGRAHVWRAAGAAVSLS